MNSDQLKKLVNLYNGSVDGKKQAADNYQFLSLTLLAEIAYQLAKLNEGLEPNLSVVSEGR